MPVAKVPHELELKLELASGPLPTRARIGQALGAEFAEPDRVEQVESLYFDTPEGRLRDHGVSFRLRRNGKRVLQTIKCIDASDLCDRGEWETDIARAEPDWKAAQRTDVGPLLTKRVRRAMKPLFTTRVRRTIYPLSTARAKIELALDSGSIVADGRSEPVQELELELKAGDSSELFRLARELSRAMPARLCLKSKAERGYRLLNGGTPGAVRAGSIDLSPSTKLADAFRMIARSCLAQIIGNDAAVETEHPEALHQMRIGLRRLRAATAFFSPILAGSQTDLMKAEFKWLTQELSPARDLDVYTSQVLDPVREKYQADPEFNGICREFERRRAEAFGRAKDAIRSERYRQFLIDVAAWIQTGDWARAGRKGGRPEPERDIKTYAAEQLNRRRKKILKDIERFDR